MMPVSPDTFAMRTSLAGARTSGPAFEQLVDQLYEARRGCEEIVEKFRAEVDALKAELREELAKRAQLQALSEWPQDRASADLGHAN
jgi:hypothetical protein